MIKRLGFVGVALLTAGTASATGATNVVSDSVASALYCVVDLSGGTSAASYPVSYFSAAPADGWTDEYKTTKLVLRRIEAGTFIMGEDQSKESHRVTLTKPFYVGVFEVTQKQWELVMGSNPSLYKGNTRPVEKVSYNDIRGSSDGARWPSSSAVDATSFLGKLRAKTGLGGFDLPTEAQWEYACRAGTTSKYNNGGDTVSDLKSLGRYSNNTSDGRGGYASAHTVVGSYASNGWGLYDMHGNAFEWCLDWSGTRSYGTDPEGPISGTYRIKRGGSWSCTASESVSFGCYHDTPNNKYGDYGFRLVCLIPGDGDSVSDDSGSGDDGGSGDGDPDDATSSGAPTVSDLTVTPVAPWGMALDYTVGGATDAEANVPVSVTATADGTNYVARHLFGATNWVNGTHRVYWNMAKDGITATVANSVVTVAAAGSASVSNVAWRAHGESAPVTDALQIDYVPDGNGSAVVGIDGRTVVDSATSGTYMWQPQTTGTYSVVHSGWDDAFAASYVVTDVVSDRPFALTVSNVVACQRWPWNGLVDIDYTIGGDGTKDTALAVRMTDGDTGRTYVPTNFLGGVIPPPVAGRHRITWDTVADGLDLISSNVTIEVSIVPAPYCVVDLSGGTSAASYPVSYLPAVPAGGWTDAYKTTKLVLRRIEAGTFIMGDDQANESHRVTLTKPFYMGVFEVTQKQWELVMGSNPSYYTGDTRPVEKVSYNDIRGSSVGANWPSSSVVDTTSFLGKLRAKTGLDGFDLPTEAQWEYACRAGTTSTYNNGGSTTNDLKTLGRYSGNTSDGRGGYTSAHTTVGSYAPNAWGLYDMHGNVWEWCLDRYNYSLSYGIDPVGASSGSYRVLRGGSWSGGFDDAWSSYRYFSLSPSFRFDDYGFRLSKTLNNKAE